MPRYSGAYSTFIARLEEVDSLERIALEYNARGPVGYYNQEINALCRGAVVLLCAHIEGFIEDLCGIIVRRIYEKNIKKSVFSDGFRYYFSKDLVDEIKNTSDAAGISKKIGYIFDRDGHIWSNEEVFIKELDCKRFMTGFSTPSPDEIYKLFRRIGFERLKGDLTLRMAGDFRFYENIIVTVVDTRNKIAHGDYMIAKTPDDLRAMKEKTKIFCRTLDQCVGDWCGQQGFSIRI